LKLIELQQEFVLCISKLIMRAYEMGYKLTLGEGYVSSRTGHMPNSLHYIKLAHDFNLFKDGKYQQNTESYKELGEFWKSLSTPDYECCWGGDFKAKDGNHFSIAYNGRK